MGEPTWNSMSSYYLELNKAVLVFFPSVDKSNSRERSYVVQVIVKTEQ
jgi:hypothetical protein